MLSFKQWLFERQFKKGKIQLSGTDREIVDVIIFKNPSGADWKIIPDEARGILMENGDLYLATRSGSDVDFGEPWFIHSDIIEFLQAVLPIKLSNPGMFDMTDFRDMKMIPVQRSGNTKKFYISESMGMRILDRELNQKYALMVYGNAKKKNPSLTFVYKKMGR